MSRAAEPVTLTPDWSVAPKAIGPEFSGFSFETQLVLPNADGVHYFRADNAPLVNLFKTLGIKHVRVGGNTSDNPKVDVPSFADIDSLFAFAHAAGVKVVYTVRLKGQVDASADIPIVKYIHDRYATDLDCFAIGNEPTVYFKQYAAAKQYPLYHDLWLKMAQEIEAAVPGVMFCGPNTDRHYDWAVSFAQDFASTGWVKEINEHAYVGLSARNVTDVAAARDKMLSNDWVHLYQGVYDAFAPAVMSDKLPYRLEETNSFFNGGKEGASDTFTAALWALDYQYWWAEHDAAGINFHTGDKVAAGADSAICRYAAYVSAGSGYDVKPVGYAIKAFDVGAHGWLVPVGIGSPGHLNLSAYAVAAADGSVYLTVINKEHEIEAEGSPGSAASGNPAGSPAKGPETSDARPASLSVLPADPPRDAAITIEIGNGFSHGQAMFLTCATHDITAKTGITLGGQGIGNDASWSGGWTPLEATAKMGRFTLTVPYASAAIVELKKD